jgi:hypothetical protein
VLVLLGVGEGIAFAQPAPPLSSGPSGTHRAAETPAVLPAESPGTVNGGQGEKQPGVVEGPKVEPAPAFQSQPCPGGCGPEQGGGAQRVDLRRTHCGPEERLWGRAGVLLWWLADAPAPGPLVTTGPAAGAGVLGSPGTQVLVGNEGFDLGGHIGVTLEGGAWLDDCRHWGVALGGFILERQGQGQLFTSDVGGSPVLARPFVNAITNENSSLAVSSPGITAGSVAYATSIQFAGGEANVVRNLAHSPECDVQLLAGFRYLDLSEELNVFHNSVLLSGVLGGDPVGTRNLVADRFSTRNQLYLGQVGGRVEWTTGPLFVGLLGKVGLGPNHQRVLIEGSTTKLVPGRPNAAFPGGFLAVPGTASLAGGNVGVHTTNWFVVAPEVGVEVGVNLSKHLRLSAGYNFLFINSVARPGSQVNPTINPALLPSSLAFGSPSGPGQPSVLTKQDDFWAHGVRLMVEFRF